MVVLNEKGPVFATYHLAPYQGPGSRHTCPSCGKRGEFVRYVDSATGEAIADHVGRCNREVNCGYHFTPKQFFEEGGKRQVHAALERPSTQLARSLPEANGRIDLTWLEKSKCHYEQNHFVRFLQSLFSDTLTRDLVQRFHIGTSRYWPGATIFWQVDRHQEVRTGKIMLYDAASGKRVKEPHGHFQWVHRILNKDEFLLDQCLFGEHQLLYEPAAKPVALVESEKTAVLASVFMPGFVWMATGGIAGLSPDKVRALRGRNLTLWPDVNAYQKWLAKARELRKTHVGNIRVTDFLELNATEQARAAGYDVADYLVERDPKWGWALSEGGYPQFWDYVPTD